MSSAITDAKKQTTTLIIRSALILRDSKTAQFLKPAMGCDFSGIQRGFSDNVSSPIRVESHAVGEVRPLSVI